MPDNDIEVTVGLGVDEASFDQVMATFNKVNSALSSFAADNFQNVPVGLGHLKDPQQRVAIYDQVNKSKQDMGQAQNLANSDIIKQIAGTRNQNINKNQDESNKLIDLNRNRQAANAQVEYLKEIAENTADFILELKKSGETIGNISGSNLGDRDVSVQNQLLGSFTQIEVPLGEEDSKSVAAKIEETFTQFTDHLTGLVSIVEMNMGKFGLVADKFEPILENLETASKGMVARFTLKGDEKKLNELAKKQFRVIETEKFTGFTTTKTKEYADKVAEFTKNPLEALRLQILTLRNFAGTETSGKGKQSRPALDIGKDLIGVLEKITKFDPTKQNPQRTTALIRSIKETLFGKTKALGGLSKDLVNYATAEGEPKDIKDRLTKFEKLYKQILRFVDETKEFKEQKQDVQEKRKLLKGESVDVTGSVRLEATEKFVEQLTQGVERAVIKALEKGITLNRLDKK